MNNQYRTLGVLVNPVAGAGGELALHGSDVLTPELQDVARRAGRAGRRMEHALTAIDPATRARLKVLAGPGPLGADLLDRLGWPHEPVDQGAVPTSGRTEATHTRAAARAMADRVDLLLFAGGDGTAVDVAVSVPPETVVLGVPAGVKMHSAVFAVSPAAAGRVARDHLAAADPASREADVLDLPDQFGEGGPVQLTALRTPDDPARLQSAKATGHTGGQHDLIALGGAVVDDGTRDGVATWVLGPGVTVDHVARALGTDGTLRGVDVVGPDGVLRDVTESELHAAVWTACRRGRRVRLVLGVVGGQGFLLGRGNQQISRRVLDLLAEDDVEVLAAVDKMTALDPAVLLVDLGAGGLPRGLSGYRAVRTAPTRRVVLRVVDTHTILVPPAGLDDHVDPVER